MKRISFIMLSYNSEKYLLDCINAILKIKKYEIELIIVDNGSTDASIRIIEKIKSNKIKLIKLDKNYGTTISRNKALNSIEKTDYICILDSDTIINENAVNIMINYLEKNDKAGIVGPAMVDGNNEFQIPYRKFPNWKIKLLKAIPIKSINSKGEKMESYELKNVTDEFSCDYLISACWMLKFNVYKILGGLDEKIFYAPEDVEYCMRAKLKGYEIVHLRNAKIIHFYQRISKKKFISKANLTHLIGLHYVLKKYKIFLKKYANKEELL